MNRILVITNKDSDLLQLLKAHCNTTVIGFDAPAFDPSGFDALCVLAGVERECGILPAPLHDGMQKMRAEGKPVFCEFVGSIGASRQRAVLNTERRRMVYSSAHFPIAGLENGDLFDGQSNECLRMLPVEKDSFPLLVFHDGLFAHSRLEMDEQAHREGDWALFFLDKTTLVSSIRLCNFRLARFAPRARWKSLITALIAFLAGEAVSLRFAPDVYFCREATVRTAQDVTDAVRLGIDWIFNAGIPEKGGEGGAHEGFTNRISARTGEQGTRCGIRADCTGEIGGALLFDALLTGNAASASVAEKLFDFNFRWLQVKDGAHRGMMRWSELAWESCFQDDVARAVLPLLLCPDLGANIPHLDEICDALDYMLLTTGEDGIRTSCTEIRELTPERIAELRKAGSGAPCAHFNAYYHAALLLAYRACGKREYLEVGKRGLETLMTLYPDTTRETSETEEACRLVFPLAVLYGITRETKHYEWLCRVTGDLEKFRHRCGGYAEWDTGYRAACSRRANGECALLANNGDPVADLLYSVNWLPLGFSYAYHVTGEERFHDLWASVSSFLVCAQMHSELPSLNGAWARAFDMDTREFAGVPYDIGWGPYCMESGWTVGEILMGLQFMHAAEKK